jgi:hypothetical protein
MQWTNYSYCPRRQCPSAKPVGHSHMSNGLKFTFRSDGSLVYFCHSAHDGCSHDTEIGRWAPAGSPEFGRSMFTDFERRLQQHQLVQFCTHDLNCLLKSVAGEGADVRESVAWQECREWIMANYFPRFLVGPVDKIPYPRSGQTAPERTMHYVLLTYDHPDIPGHAGDIRYVLP